MKKKHHLLLSIVVPALFFALAACGPTVNQIKPQQTITVNQSFQTQATPIPTVPPYRCGAWASNNAPNAFSTILIHARLTQNVKGVPGATAAATVHFQNFDLPLNQRPTSDDGGYVSFSLPLQGQQPRRIPATVDVSFTVNNSTVRCSQAFFTPQ